MLPFPTAVINVEGLISKPAPLPINCRQNHGPPLVDPAPAHSILNSTSTVEDSQVAQ